jgi:hypothetical protein
MPRELMGRVGVMRGHRFCARVDAEACFIMRTVPMVGVQVLEDALDDLLRSQVSAVSMVRCARRYQGSR